MCKIYRFLLLVLSILLSGCEQHSPSYQGYVEGCLAYIASQSSGVLKQLSVSRGQQVTSEQILFVLEQQPEIDQLAQAQAEQKQSEANVALTEIIFNRQKALVKNRAASQESLDNATKNLAQAKADLEKVKALVQQMQWTTAQKIIKAGNASVVFDTYYLPGELVPAGRPVLSLLSPKDIKIIFFVSENELANIRLNQSITVHCDSCDKKIAAKINFISPQAEYTPPVIYSNERRDKLIYRIEAMPLLTDADQLHPGQPIQVSLTHD